MENKLDKLFRDKLEQHSVAPSAHAWEKVAAGFPKKNNSWTLSWRIAAAIALLAVVSWLAFDFSQPREVQITKKETIEQPTIEQPKQNVEDKEALKSEKKDEKFKKPAPVQNTVAQRIISKPVQQSVKEEENEILIKDIQLDQTISSVEEVTEPVAIQEPTVQPAQAKAMVIVYNLAPVEKKQEVEPAKTNTLKKVLEFAKDVKSGDATTFASVRNWKDNLLGSEELTRVEKQNNE